MCINFVHATNSANHYATLPRVGIEGLVTVLRPNILNFGLQFNFQLWPQPVVRAKYRPESQSLQISLSLNFGRDNLVTVLVSEV